MSELLGVSDWVILGVVIIILTYYLLTCNHGHFSRVGIPGPRPFPLIGTAYTLMKGQNVMQHDLALHKKYGKFVGLFEGAVPVLLVADAQWLKEAFIKNFKLTTDRRPVVIGGAFEDGMFTTEGEHWKHTRAQLSPAFTSGKLKKMVPGIQRYTEVLATRLKDYNGTPVDFKRHLVAVTVDLIAVTAFGVEVNAQEHPDGPFSRHAMIVSGELSNNSFIDKLKLVLQTCLVLLVPIWLARILDRKFGISAVNTGAMDFFTKLSNDLIQSAKQGDSSSADNFIYMMSDKIVEEGDDPAMEIDNQGRKWTRKGLTKNDVIGNAILFFLAGFTTTTDTLIFLFYELAYEQEIQQKLYDELADICNAEDLTAEQLNRLTFTECCINEAMRLYPQSLRFDRHCKGDMTIKGVTVPKGTMITASGYALNTDPEVWENPLVYDPERFSAARMPDGPPAGFNPFGMGNRACIGSRLAMMQMKIIILSVIRKFKVLTCSQTPSRPIKLKAAINNIPEKAIYLIFKKR